MNRGSRGRRYARGMRPHGRPVYSRSFHKGHPKSRFEPPEYHQPCSDEEDLTEAERFVIEESHHAQAHHDKPEDRSKRCRKHRHWSKDGDSRYYEGHRERTEERYSRSRSRSRSYYRESRDRDRERDDRNSWHNHREHSMHREEDHDHDIHEYRHDGQSDEEYQHYRIDGDGAHEYTSDHDEREPPRYLDGSIDLREIIRNREGMRSPRSDSQQRGNGSRDRYYEEEVTTHVQDDYYDGIPVPVAYMTDLQASQDQARKRTRWSKQNFLCDQSSSSSNQQFPSTTYPGPQVEHFNAQAPSQHLEEKTHPGQFISSKDSHPDIPVFDGLNQDVTPRQFIQIIDDLGDNYRWTGDDRKCQMAAKLQGEPKEWLMKDDRMCEAWDKIKSIFIKAHPTDMDYHHMLERMLERTKYENESFSNYFMFKTMLMNAVGITGRRAVSCLIGGLVNPNLRKYCYQENFAAPDALYAYLNCKGQDADSVPNQKKTNNEVSQPKAKHENSSNSQNSKTGSHREVTIKLINDHKPFSLSTANYELKHLLTVKIKNHLLDAYNDMSAQCLTITEEIAKSINLDYNKRRTTIIGFRGVPVLALGDCEVTIGADQAVIRIRIYVVPNISQEKPVVIGKSFREHQDLSYVETENSIGFKQPKSYQNSFSMTEKRKDKT